MNLLFSMTSARTPRGEGSNDMAPFYDVFGRPKTFETA